MPENKNQKRNWVRDLVIPEKLQEMEIIMSCKADSKSIIVGLNHKYDRRTVISPIVKDDLPKTEIRLENELERKGVSEDHIVLIRNMIDENYELIFDPPPVESDEVGCTSSTSKPRSKAKIPTIQKYRIDELLAEAVMIGNQPFFAIATDNGQVIRLEKSIPLGDGSSLVPPSMYLNSPYVFKSDAEFDRIIDQARHETIDSIYKKVKRQWEIYSSADDIEISLCAADTIFTYFQDSFGMTHYLFFVGAPDSGKSNRLTVFKFLAYRNYTGIDITPANIYRFYGQYQEAQGTICEDEADNLDNNPEKLKIYKSGYIGGFKVARNDDTEAGMVQGGFYTYSFKAFAAEHLPDVLKSKGFRDRIIPFKCLPDVPKYDIAEVMDNSMAEEFAKLRCDIEELRNLLMAFRLASFNVKIPNIGLNIDKREKQLFKPLLRLFQGSNTQKAELLSVVSELVKRRREFTSGSIHAVLYRVIRNLLDVQPPADKYTLESSTIWATLKGWLPGEEIPRKPLSYETVEFGEISHKKISEILLSDFSAKRPEHTGNTRELIFDSETLAKLKKKYDLELSIEVKSESDSVSFWHPTQGFSEQNRAQNESKSGFESDMASVQENGGMSDEKTAKTDVTSGSDNDSLQGDDNTSDNTSDSTVNASKDDVTSDKGAANTDDKNLNDSTTLFSKTGVSDSKEGKKADFEHENSFQEVESDAKTKTNPTRNSDASDEIMTGEELEDDVYKPE